MEIQNLLQKNNKINIERRKSLNYLAFIKFLAMIKIIKWHIYKFKKNRLIMEQECAKFYLFLLDF